MIKIENSASPTRDALLFGAFSVTKGALQNATKSVIPSQCAHWRGNPYAIFGGKRIATAPNGASQ